jgi:hypothetical protein
MAVPIEFFRGVLGFICAACAYMAGRTFVTVRKGWHKPSRLYGWLVRMILCLAAVAFRHPVDTVDIVVWIVAAVAFSAAVWDVSREKKHEDLGHTIFRDEP